MKRATRIGAAGCVAVFALCLLSCPDHPHRGARGRGPGGQPGLSALDELRFGTAQVRAALFSVAYHSVKKPPRLPSEMLPIPLKEAAGILREGAKADAFGESRRRRSAIDLAIVGLERADPALLARNPNNGAIKILLGDFKPKFDAALQSILLHPPPLPADLEIQDLRPELVFEWRVRLGLWRFLASELQAPFAACEITVPSMTTTTTLTNGVVEAKTWLTVKRAVGALSKAMDPQNWDAIDGTGAKACNPYFKLANEYVRDVDEQWVPAVCPHETGSQWSGHLFEIFEADFGSLSKANFSTILAIEPPSDAAPPTYGFDYKLRKSYVGKVQINPYGPMPRTIIGEIDTDAGEFDASASAGSVQLEAVKRLHFQGWHDVQWKTPWDDAMNAWAETTLQAMGGAVAEAVCCTPPPDPPPCASTGGTP